jgi:hypothetical protein
MPWKTILTVSSSKNYLGWNKHNITLAKWKKIQKEICSKSKLCVPFTGKMTSDFFYLSTFLVSKFSGVFIAFIIKKERKRGGLH